MSFSAHNLDKSTAAAPVHSGPVTANDKRLQFIATLKDEIRRGLSYAHEADRNRAPKQDTFIDQVAKKINSLMSSLPAVASAAGTAITNAVSAMEEKKRDGKLALVSNLVKKLDPARLEVLLDSFAREALRRYEAFIVDRLEDNLDTVIQFAEVGAERILYNLSCQDKAQIQANNGLLLTESILLKGLIEGRSGKGVDGIHNKHLKLKDHGPHSLKDVTAECVYGRPAFQVFEIAEGKLVNKLFTRETTFKEGLNKIVKGTANPFSKLRKKEKGFEHDPKAGFIVVDQATVDEYKYKLEAEKKSSDFEFKTKESISSVLQNELKNCTSHSIAVIDLATFNHFLEWSRKNDRKSILEYMRQEFKLP